MKTIFFILSAAFLSSVALGQGPNWSWAKNSGGSANEHGYGVAADQDGNVYVTGLFTSPSITFDTITLINNSLSGQFDLYLVKYDNDGNVIWAKSAGGINYDRAYSVAIDNTGDIFITGGFTSPTLILGSDTLTSSGGNNIFIAKYNNNGNVLWARTATGTFYQGSLGVCTDNFGNACITGFFEGNSITFGAYTLTNSGGTDVFIAKYDANGSVMWAKSGKGKGGTSKDEYGNGICSDKEGNFFITGRFDSDTLIFDLDTIINTNNLNYSDVFLVKYSNSGSVLWARKMGGINNDEGNGVTTDGFGNVYVTGRFGTPSAMFDSITLTNSGSADIFLVKLTSSGNIVWAEGTGTQNSDIGFSVCVDNSNNVLVGGTYNYDKLIIKKYSSAGYLIWTKSDSSSNYISSIYTDASDFLYAAGSIYGSTSLDSISLITNGLWDMYIAKLNTSSISVGIQNNALTVWSIFPNPFSTQLTFSFADNEQTTVSLYSFLGLQVMQHTYTNSITINTEQLADGIYFFELSSNKGTLKTGKIVKQ